MEVNYRGVLTLEKVGFLICRTATALYKEKFVYNQHGRSNFEKL